MGFSFLDTPQIAPIENEFIWSAFKFKFQLYKNISTWSDDVWPCQLKTIGLSCFIVLLFLGRSLHIVCHQTAGYSTCVSLCLPPPLLSSGVKSAKTIFTSSSLSWLLTANQPQVYCISLSVRALHPSNHSLYWTSFKRSFCANLLLPSEPSIAPLSLLGPSLRLPAMKAKWRHSSTTSPSPRHPLTR